MINKTKKILLSFLLVSIAIFIVPITIKICNTYATVQAAKVKITKSSKVLYVGYGRKLNVTGTNKKIKWISDNPSIASVTQGGYVQAKAPGKVTIKAVVDNKTYTSSITIKQTAYLDLYSTRSMQFIDTNKQVKYYSSNSNIVSIDKKGKVTANNVGTVKITAKTGSKKYSCTLQVTANGWYTNPKGEKYYYENNHKVTGWKYIGKYKYYFYKNSGVLDQNVASRLTGEQSYYIHVNRKKCQVTIFAKDGENEYTIPVMAMTCSVGTSRNQTPKGTYNTMSRTRWGLLMGPSYGQYCTRIVDGILFHSVAGYNKTSYNLSYRDYNKLGQPASHGCVRLCVRDAKWIYDNCKIGTTVTIDDKSDGCKFDKPKMKKIKASQHYDPTDPNVKRK